MVLHKSGTTKCSSNQSPLFAVWVNTKLVRILHFLTSFLRKLYHKTSENSTERRPGGFLPINKFRSIRRPSFDEAGGGTKTGVITTMGDPFELLRHAQTAYNNDLRPWEQSKEYWDRLKKFCDYSERWRKEQEKDIVWPKPKDVGVVRKGTTEWDVFHELSMKRLKRNGIHL